MDKHTESVINELKLLAEKYQTAFYLNGIYETHPFGTDRCQNIIQVLPGGTVNPGLTLRQAEVRHILWLAELLVMCRHFSTNPERISPIFSRTDLAQAVIDLIGQTSLTYGSWMRSQIQETYLEGNLISSQATAIESLEIITGLPTIALVGRFEKEPVNAHQSCHYQSSLLPIFNSPEQVVPLLASIATQQDCKGTFAADVCDQALADMDLATPEKREDFALALELALLDRAIN